MKSILIPIDFSENSIRAVSAAKLIADKHTTRLFLLHAYQPNPMESLSDPNLTGIASPEMIELSMTLEDDFKTKLKEDVESLQEDGFKAEAIWAVGNIHAAVEQAIKDHQPEMVVVGRTGTGGFLDKLIGSAATKIALNAPCPVMVVPPESDPQAFRHVVYATELEYDENDILREVIPLIKGIGGHLKFLKVDSDSQPDIAPDNQFLAQIQNEFALPFDDFVIREARHVIDGIEAYCNETHVDLLIMSSRERSFIEEYLINPSITKKMVINTHVPLLVYHLNNS